MSFDWLAWSNPVAVWWGFLLIVSGANITMLLILHRCLRERLFNCQVSTSLLFLCAAYVFGCAFRSVLPRADVQRICLFDTWLSSIFIGRSVATVAEICFAAQWAIIVRWLAILGKSNTARWISTAVVPLIVCAEGCSWYAVITTDYFGNTIENSLWAVTFLLIAFALLRIRGEFGGVIRVAIGAAITGICGYVIFLATIDVPMYYDRWLADAAAGKHLLGVLAGLHDVSTHWQVTHDFTQWKDEIAWMSLYFSAAVWSSLALCGFVVIKDKLPSYSTRSAISTQTGQRLAARINA
jgi:hypothetical protein